MLKEFENLKTLEDWGKHQFNANLSAVFGWGMLGEQHFLVSKVLLMECWMAKNEYYSSDIREFEYGTREFELLQKTYFYEPATLFLALSFENFLKGIWVKENETTLIKSDSIPNLLKTHYLNKLARECTLNLSKEEEEMLKLLAIFSTWRGRYNLPLNKKKNVNFWEGKFQVDFLIRKYPGDFGFPDEVKSLRMKISERLNRNLL